MIDETLIAQLNFRGYSKVGVIMIAPDKGIPPEKAKHFYNIVQCWTKVEDVGLTLYTCYTHTCFAFTGIVCPKDIKCKYMHRTLDMNK